MCSCNSILECCIMFSGVKLSMGSFVLFLKYEHIIYSFEARDHQNLSNDIYFVWFLRGQHFPIVFHCFW